MVWDVRFFDAFSTESLGFSEEVREEIALKVVLLREFGPRLSRPHADTLNGSRHANMKELRFKADNGVWRVAFAFDPERKAVLLIAGDKSGVSENRFYKTLIATADERFDSYLEDLKKGK
jgi:hypothetical protein